MKLGLKILMGFSAFAFLALLALPQSARATETLTNYGSQEPLGSLEAELGARTTSDCSNCAKHFKQDQCSITEDCGAVVNRVGRLVGGKATANDASDGTE